MLGAQRWASENREPRWREEEVSSKCLTVVIAMPSREETAFDQSFVIDVDTAGADQPTWSRNSKIRIPNSANRQILSTRHSLQRNSGDPLHADQ